MSEYRRVKIVDALTKVTICIVNWNAGNQLRDCISSIGNARNDNSILLEVVVVDNGSTDKSCEGIDQLGVAINIIRNGENRGFACACNQGAAVASGNYLLFLNPDTRLFKNSLVVPFAFMELDENAHIGICGIQLVDELGKACLSYAKFPRLRDFTFRAVGIDKFVTCGGMAHEGVVPEAERVRVVDQVIGAFFVVRRSVFEELGGFDEHFFVYFEEVDFALRARKKGWLSVCLSGAQCIHIGGGSSRQVKAARLFYSLRSRTLYGFKHFPLMSAIALFAVTLVPELLGRLVSVLAQGSLRDLKHVVHGYSMLIKDMPAILRNAAAMRGR